LLASGQGDTISPRPELETLARRLPRAEVAIVPGTDHFFWHREKELAGRIADFADQVLATAARGGERRPPR
jgi:pimeloyl-ACP methyl ester carboxylesterase